MDIEKSRQKKKSTLLKSEDVKTAGKDKKRRSRSGVYVIDIYSCVTKIINLAS